jgi:hypothetical protein
MPRLDRRRCQALSSKQWQNLEEAELESLGQTSGQDVSPALFFRQVADALVAGRLSSSAIQNMVQ